MTASKFETRIKAAQGVRDTLKAEGRHREAQIIDGLCRSAATSRGALKQLHADLQEARAAAGLPHFGDPVA